MEQFLQSSVVIRSRREVHRDRPSEGEGLRILQPTESLIVYNQESPESDDLRALSFYLVRYGDAPLFHLLACSL